MWTRRTFHECAAELSQISREFRTAYMSSSEMDTVVRDRTIQETSVRGVEVLRVLALSVRSDQDTGLTERGSSPVGALISGLTADEARSVVAAYRPPFKALENAVPLHLRQALNKIAHADPRVSSFFANEDVHDLVLSGEYQGTGWVAVVSLVELCDVIGALPDTNAKA